ncbi:hypothetical protein PQX77_010633, partial [Marasmius sp. AFHP31]
MTIVCNGCGKHFTLWGIRRHLAQTSNPSCIHYGDTHNMIDTRDLSHDGICLDDPSMFSDDSTFDHNLPAHDVDFDFDFDTKPQSFQGDYLGEEYTLNDLGQGGDDDMHGQAAEDWPGEPAPNRHQNHHSDAIEDGEVDGSVEDGRDLDDFDDDEMNAMWEDGWEPARSELALGDSSDSEEGEGDEGTSHPATPARRTVVEDRLRQPPVVVRFGGHAGQPLADGSKEDADTCYKRALGKDSKDRSLWYPFTSQLDWEVARWAKLRGPGSNAFNELLKIPGVVDSLGLSFKTTQELNKVIDEHLPGRPAFRHEEVVVAGEAFEFYHRDILECVKALWGDPDLSSHLIVYPERHYTDDTRSTRVYHNMHTGDWWWATQEEVEKTNPGATIIPIIISSDKTQLTVFGNKTAYPVYVSIGNIPKEIRRKTSRGAYLLL